MSLVGQTLKGRRERLGMTLTELENRTEIKRQALTLIENNDFESLKNADYEPTYRSKNKEPLQLAVVISLVIIITAILWILAVLFL